VIFGKKKVLKMNKYKESLNEILKRADEIITMNDKQLDDTQRMLRGKGVRISLCAQSLQELVEKAVPKKPDLKLFDNGQGDWVECPSCHKNLGHPTLIAKQKNKYCRFCGQSLDWSVEDE
jgi:hypothetical protein